MNWLEFFPWSTHQGLKFSYRNWIGKLQENITHEVEEAEECPPSNMV